MAQDVSISPVLQVGTTAKLLLVDDRPENLIALEAVLEPLGQDLVTAKSGPEALKHLLTEDFAVILLDVQMPIMDGFETATLIKQRPKSRHIPIIFLTAISKEDQYVFQGYSAGAVDYLTKPINPDILRSKVRVFVELYQQQQTIREQEARLRESERLQAEAEALERERLLQEEHFQELTEREARLREFQETLDATHDGVLIFDPHDLNLRYTNQGARRLIEPTISLGGDLLALSPAHVLTEGSEEALRGRISSFLVGKNRVQTYETALFKSEGSSTPVEVSLQYIAPTGEKPRCVAIVRDITERKEAQSRLAAMYEREKRIADVLQNSIVLAPPTDMFPGLTIATSYISAWDEARIGGDFFDVFALDAGRVAFIVGDVSGKGLEAAAHTAEVKFALRAFLRETSDPARALARLNDVLCETQRLEKTSFGTYVCLSLAIMEPSSGETTVASAGMEQPLIIHDGQAEAIAVNGVPLGIEAGLEYTPERFRLNRGDTLSMASDGITEARRGRDMFGYEGYTETAAKHAALSLPEIADQIVAAARNFAGGKLQDDVCLLMVRRQ